MIFQCPHCGASYQIADSKMPKAGAYGLCVKCKTRFFLGTNRRSGRDRRTGDDRRKAYHTVEDDFPYLLKGGRERRSWVERRSKKDRRAGWPMLKKASVFH